MNERIERLQSLEDRCTAIYADVMLENGYDTLMDVENSKEAAYILMGLAQVQLAASSFRLSKELMK